MSDQIQARALPCKGLLGAPCGHDRASHHWYVDPRWVGEGKDTKLANVNVSGDCLCSGCTCKGYVPAA
jgi:hypothetical protein